MEAAIDRIMLTYDLLLNRTAAASAEARAKVTEYLTTLIEAGEKDTHRLTVCGLTYLRELDGSSDPVKAGLRGCEEARHCGGGISLVCVAGHTRRAVRYTLRCNTIRHPPRKPPCSRCIISTTRARSGSSGCWKNSARPTRSSATSAMPNTRLAPPELKAVHPLGKSPVITDGDITIAESGAIVDYIIRTLRQGRDDAGARQRRLSKPTTSGCIIRKARRCCR